MRQAVREIRTLNISPVSRALEGERFRFGTGGCKGYPDGAFLAAEERGRSGSLIKGGLRRTGCGALRRKKSTGKAQE